MKKGDASPKPCNPQSICAFARQLKQVKSGFGVPVGFEARHATLDKMLQFPGRNALAQVTEATKTPGLFSTRDLAVERESGGGAVFAVSCCVVSCHVICHAGTP